MKTPLSLRMLLVLVLASLVKTKLKVLQTGKLCKKTKATTSSSMGKTYNRYPNKKARSMTLKDYQK